MSALQDRPADGASTPPAEIFAPVLARLQTEAAQHFGAAARVLPLAYEERPFSHVLRASVACRSTGRAPACVFIKIFKPKSIDGVEAMRQRVAHDFHTTCRIYQAMAQSDDFGVVRPIAWFPEHLAVVTEQAEGDTLLAYLQAHARWFPGPATRRALVDTLAAVGRWIRAFQSIDMHSGRVSIPELLAYVDVRLTRLVAHGVFTPSDRRRILGHLEALGDCVASGDRREAIIHADLAPGNILVSGRRIVVLDLAMTQRGSVLHDVSRLFLQLDLLGAKPQFRAAVVGDLQRALLRGFDPELTPARPLFRLLLMLHRVNHLGTLSLSRESLRSRAFSSHICRLHRRWIARQLRLGAPVEAVS